jgi:hypothetical protein
MMSEPSAEALAPHVLGPLLLDEKTPLAIELRGGEGVVRGGKQKFALQPKDGGQFEWEIAITGGETPLVVAMVSVKEKQLMFQWTPEGARNEVAPLLGNCALDLTAGTAHRHLALRQPLMIEPLAVDLEKPSTLSKSTIDHLPDPKKIVVEISRLSSEFPKYRFDESQQLEGASDSAILWTGADENAFVLGIRLDSSVGARLVQLKGAAQLKLPGMARPKPLQKRDLQELDATIKSRGQALAVQERIATEKKASTEQKNVIKAAQNKNNQDLDQLNQLLELITSLHGKGRIHFRAYYQADDAQVDLLATEEPAAAKKQEPAAKKK